MLIWLGMEGVGKKLADTDEWSSLEEAKVSSKCKNVIAWDEQGPVLWRSKLTWVDLIILTQLKRKGAPDSA